MPLLHNFATLAYMSAKAAEYRHLFVAQDCQNHNENFKHFHTMAKEKTQC